MARYIGIDIGSSHVRALLLSTGYKRIAIEAVQEVAIDAAESLEQAIQACASGMLPHSDGIAVAVDGDSAFVHRMKLPLTARKQLDAVLPFELESQMPVDMSELVYDYRVLRGEPTRDAIDIIAALARTEHVKSRIELIKRALGREPERVGCGSLVLGNLALLTPELRGKAPVALVDLGSRRTEVTVLSDGEPLFVRTLSRGVAGLPETAAALIADLRQTFLAFLSKEDIPVDSVILLGGGASASGADQYLSHELGVPVRALPTFQIEPAAPEIVLALPRFAKALSLAAGLSGKAVDMNLRSGPLAYQRGFGFLKERAPLLAGLTAATLVSFLFASWASLRALSREHDELTQSLAAQTQQILGEELSDPDAVSEAIDRAKSKDEPDPMPHMDAFDMVVELSNAIPISVVHDIEEFDVQRGHVKVNGVVGTTKDAQDIASKMGENRCVSEPKIAKVSQVVNGDRQKYVLEFDIKCPEDAGPKKKPKPADAPTEDKP
ncbi:MAG TPA: pilus assembly protein PilM [Polyangiaceae bacterium]|jgi:general secretion pathway protein L|nr:pilus assembly protein PilM [Polyangiaceae bacterium]